MYFLVIIVWLCLIKSQKIWVNKQLKKIYISIKYYKIMNHYIFNIKSIKKNDSTNIIIFFKIKD